MLRALILSLLIVAAFGANVNRDVSERILGGHVVQSDTDYPSKCVLRYYGNFHCGCVVLDENHVLTTARCTRVTSTLSMAVHVGSNHIQAGGLQYDVTNKTEHFDFVYEDIFSSDICVLKVAGPMEFSDTVGAVTLPEQDAETPAAAMSTIIGWGYSAYNGPLNPSLLEAEVPILDWQSCSDTYATEGIMTDRQICTDVSGDVGVCNGDNGGPLFVDGVIHGITSWTSDQCAATQGFPGVYTRVASFSDWIAETVQL